MKQIAEETQEEIQVVRVTWATGRVWFYKDGNGFAPCKTWIISSDPLVDATVLMWEKVREGFSVEIRPSIWE